MNLPPHLAAMQTLFNQLAEPARCECPLCKGRCEISKPDREVVCRVCNGKGTVVAADYAIDDELRAAWLRAKEGGL